MSTPSSTVNNVARWALRWAAKRTAQAAVSALGGKVILILLLVALLFLIPVLAVLGVGLFSIFTSEPPRGTVGQIAGVKYADIFNEAAAHASAKYGVNLSPALLAAMAKQESGFDPQARSEAGARGVLQVMPFNAKGADLMDPRENIFRGAEIIASHLKRYNGNVRLALSAYNSGAGAVARDLAKGGDGIPENGETPQYVANVLKFYEDYSKLVKNGEIVAAMGGGALGLPAETEISCGFTCYENHGGVDFSGRGNRAVYAAADGVVVRKEHLGDRSYGTLLVINHGGIQTAYAHMYPEDILVNVGERVQRGQRIGTMGNYGKSSGVHLHFEVRKDGKRIDPTPYLQEKR